MTYQVGQMVTLSTTMTGTGTAPTMILVVTRPDGTTISPSLTLTTTGSGPFTWTWTGTVTVNQAGDWLYVFTASGSYAGVDDGQFHVVATGLRIVGLGEVKEHGNITSTANDRELLDFIGTAQQMIEDLVGVTVPVTVTAEVHDSVGLRLWLRKTPVLSVTSVTEYAGTTAYTPLTASDWWLDPATGALTRVHGHWLGDTVQVTYQPGRRPIPEAIRWAAKELTIHLWRATQAQRGGRGRGTTDAEGAVAALGFALPNRVVDALVPFKLPPAVG